MESLLAGSGVAVAGLSVIRSVPVHDEEGSAWQEAYNFKVPCVSSLAGLTTVKHCLERLIAAF